MSPLALLVLLKLLTQREVVLLDLGIGALACLNDLLESLGGVVG